MSKGISARQQQIIELLAIRPTGLPHDILRAQLWPELFCVDHRNARNSEAMLKAKVSARVVFSRAITSLIKRGLVRETVKHQKQSATEFAQLGLKLPYQLATTYRQILAGYRIDDIYVSALLHR